MSSGPRAAALTVAGNRAHSAPLAAGTRRWLLLVAREPARDAADA